MNFQADICISCRLNIDQHDWSEEAKRHTCPAWLTERSAA